MEVDPAEIGLQSKNLLNFRGPKLLGVNAVIAESFERIHRSNLVGMGILPLQYISGQNAESLGIKGDEVFNISLDDNLKMGDNITVVTSTGTNFQVKVRLDTAPEVEYFRNNGILLYVLRKIINK
jgi:aconitate hydratase